LEAAFVYSAMSLGPTSVLASISEWVGVAIRSDIVVMVLLILYKTASGLIPVVLARAFARNEETRNGRQTTVDAG